MQRIHAQHALADRSDTPWLARAYDFLAGKFYVSLANRGISREEFMRTRYWVPNLMSYMRILGSPVPALLLLSSPDDLTVRWWATGVFAFLAISDKFDGWAAAWLNQRSKWGMVVDPIGDKLLVAFTLLAMLIVFWDAPYGFALVVLVWLILAREFILTAQIRVARDDVAPPTMLGKIKTVFQMVLIPFWLAPVVWPFWLMAGLVVITYAVTIWSWEQYYRLYVKSPNG